VSRLRRVLSIANRGADRSRVGGAKPHDSAIRSQARNADAISMIRPIWASAESTVFALGSLTDPTGVLAGETVSRSRAYVGYVHEIRISDQGDVIPVFKIPGRGGALVIDDAAQAAITTGSRNGAVGGPP